MVLSWLEVAEISARSAHVLDLGILARRLHRPGAVRIGTFAVISWGVALGAVGIALDALAEDGGTAPKGISPEVSFDKPMVRFIDRPVSFSLVLGLATPVGEVGGLIECSVAP